MGKNLKNLTSQLVILLLMSSCAAQRLKIECSPTAHKKTLKQAINWYRNSAEQKALYRQAYLAGTQYVETWVKTHRPKDKSWGVILDIEKQFLITAGIIPKRRHRQRSRLFALYIACQKINGPTRRCGFYSISS